MSARGSWTVPNSPGWSLGTRSLNLPSAVPWNGDVEWEVLTLHAAPCEAAGPGGTFALGPKSLRNGHGEDENHQKALVFWHVESDGCCVEFPRSESAMWEEAGLFILGWQEF